MSVLKRGLAGEPVKILQAKLAVPADGEFGPGTETALKAYQQKHGLKVDGIAGPDTFAQMGLFELILLKPGTSGEAVKKLQQSLGIAADGQFGAGTQKAVREFQAKNGLEADGFAGPATLAKMSLFKEMTPEVVKKSELPAGAAPAAPAPAPAPAPGAAKAAPAAPQAAPSASAPVEAPKRSIWASIRGIFGHA
ncbi:MAG TPA: peptidoglycan-binding protein [Xanthobacteraceae bacterium]|jgi:peptidoglycan hydrolase-like protein with peptidoglycan-binding domain|nr:peptidoglycan-binding protein [Xanthobacteraceae bacterium]